jgi:cardiolipin synthase
LGVVGEKLGPARIIGALRGFRIARRMRRDGAAGADRDAAPAADSRRKLTRIAAEHVFSRVAGANQIEGNSLRLLQNGAENYPAWLEAIGLAQHTIHFENYIITSDAAGRQFRDALVAKAREGVTVRVLYDWMGCLTKTRLGFWRRLREAGGEVHGFNRPRLDSPFGWLSRNHRKSLSVDGMVGYVAGLCVGDVWVGNAARKIEAWRDTGVEVRGPAVVDIDLAFAQTWKFAGGETIVRTVSQAEAVRAGEIALRVIGSKPATMGLYRFDQLIAAVARQRLWLTDAYFVGTTSYVQALIDAAQDGVDVRLLVPGASDIPVAKALSRAGYRALLEAGVRVFEWDGPMLHAKTAVADGRWGRIGSTNLNLASWAGNWELDIAVEDEGFAGQMERMFERDLDHATEIVLERRRVLAAEPRARASRFGAPRRGSPGRIAAGAAGLGSTVSAAITNHRALGPAEAKVMAIGGGLLFALSLLAVLRPLVVTFPLAALGSWVAATLVIRAIRLWGGKPQPPTDDRAAEVDITSSSDALQPDAAFSSVPAND